MAGRRAGLAGERSGLFYEFLRILAEFRPSGLVIENVPGLLSSWCPVEPPPSGVEVGTEWEVEESSDFETVIGELGQLGYRVASRGLNSQYDGVAQRRERVFIVGSLGDWPHPAEILFDSESVPGNPPPSCETGARVAACFTSGVSSGRGVNASGRRREDDVNLVVNCLDSHMGSGGPDDNAAQANHLIHCPEVAPIVPVLPFDERQVTSKHNRSSPDFGDECHTLHSDAPRIAYQCHGSNVGPMGTLREGNGNETGGVPFVFETRIGRNGCGQPSEVCHSLRGSEAGETSDMRPCVVTGESDERNDERADGSGVERGAAAVSEEVRERPGVPPVRASDPVYRVRRLTPVECERLMGFPDGWTEFDIYGKPISNSARYRMLGNSIVVPTAQWIGERICSTVSQTSNSQHG